MTKPRATTGGAGTDLDGFGEIGDGAIEVALHKTLASTIIEVLGFARALRAYRQCEIDNEKKNRRETMVKHVSPPSGARW